MAQASFSTALRSQLLNAFRDIRRNPVHEKKTGILAGMPVHIYRQKRGRFRKAFP
jgi:hypothetical protein